jgi:hypothetical protein
MTLAAMLWGRTSSDLQRQLLAPHPVIPSGFELDDFRELQRRIEEISGSLSALGQLQLSRLGSFSQTVLVGARTFTAWEARCEIVRRAIEYLENR